MKKLLLPAWIFISILLLLYSYTQVSLSLALNKTPFLFTIQQAFQHIGYFNRPLSSGLYLLLMVLLGLLYVVTLRMIWKKNVTSRTITVTVISVSSILLFSYNAFSHDIFNYIFDAKIITHYQDNPYMQKALDYPQDPMLSFIQWTHRTYPYGPFWLAITVPFSFIGMQIFLITFYLFKLLAVVAYIGTAWGIYKIVQKQKKEYALFSAAFFALNPLMIIEFLMSGHNDIVMLFFSTLAIYLAVQKKKVLSVLSIAFSVGIKYATAFLAPMFLLLYIHPKHFERAVYIGIISMIGAIIAASMKSGNFQPWYFAYVFVIAALVSYKKFIGVSSVMFTFFACLHYLPYLYTGTWDPPIPQLLSNGLIVATICSAVVCLYYLFIPFVKRSKV